MKNKTCTEQLGAILTKWNAQNKFRIKESSYNKYCYLVESNITPYLGEYKISDLTTELLQKYVYNLSHGTESKNALAPKTIRDTISVLKLALRYAKSIGLEAPCDITLLTFRIEKKELQVLSSNEYRKLIAYLRFSYDLRDAGVLLALFTGLRIGELCALTWENINLEEKYISVKYTLQRIQNRSTLTKPKTKIIISSPKSFSSKRLIPLPEFLISYLKISSK